MNPALRLKSVLEKSERTIIGLMSGMSMDGVDLACVRIGGVFPEIKLELLGTHFRPYSSAVRERLIKGQSCQVHEVSALGFSVAEEFSLCVKEFLGAKQLPNESIDAIGSHGQTLFHSSALSSKHGSTLQVAHPSVIAEKTGIITIGNFRVRDIALGGQGAPLVSLADFLLYRSDTEVIAVNNLGSISNLTVVTPTIEDVSAFDTGPANMAIDYFARLVPGNSDGIDRDGVISAKGNCIPPLLAKLLDLPFFKKKPPRAAGYEDFGPPVLDAIMKNHADATPVDLVRTAVEFSALTIRDAYEQHVLPRYPMLAKIFFSGGGIYNLTLMKRIEDLLPKLRIEIFDPTFSDAKEAISFAVLANETLSGRAGNVVGATGATKRVVLGEIAV